MNDCECELSGWCNRHQVNKSEHLMKLCKHHEGYWQQWELGFGPGQGPPPKGKITKKFRGGPGTELKKLLKSMGYHEYTGCQCKLRTNQMDAWGPEVCRERIDEIVLWLKDTATNAGWLERLLVKTPVLSQVSNVVLKRLITQAIINAENILRPDDHRPEA